MSDETPKPETGDETFWEEPAAPGQGREWMTQLQQMIEQLATQAAPVIREVGAKAAELAALAGEKAGPVAHRAAELTTEAGLKLAERSRDFAAEIRRDQAARGERPTTEESEPAGEAATTDAEAPASEETKT
ncbi:MAG TPA: hypothetical protein VJ506_01020, partial [Candidatus Limnocylindrales bacterium]|nr:hypothetical protein [Candidatus Limnocylindrales bacterium]